MTELTPLDQAHAAMQAEPEDEASRLAFYQRLAECELFLMLQSETSENDTVTPELFELQDAQYVLVFDCEERLIAFTGQTTPFVALSGRAITTMLADRDIGIGVNLDVAPSSILLPTEAVAWLNVMVGNAPDEIATRISEVSAPAGLPEQLISALDAKLATAMGLAKAAYLVAASYEDGQRGHLLAFIDAIPEAQDALARAASEALTFSGIDAGAMDVSFFSSGDRVTERFDRIGLRFDLPQLQKTVTQERAAPGMDPENPPRLK